MQSKVACVSRKTPTTIFRRYIRYLDVTGVNVRFMQVQSKMNITRTETGLVRLTHILSDILEQQSGEPSFQYLQYLLGSQTFECNYSLTAGVNQLRIRYSYLEAHCTVVLCISLFARL